MACGLEVAVRAGAELRDAGIDEVAFLLIGDGAIRAELEDEARRLGLENVLFLGRRDRSEIPGLIAASDCCLVHLRRAPLFRTVLPSKIFEALAMKRPIIVGVEGHAARIAERSGGGVCIEPDNEKELIDAIERLRNDAAFRKSLAETGHRFVNEHYNRDRLADRYLQLISELAQR